MNVRQKPGDLSQPAPLLPQARWQGSCLQSGAARLELVLQDQMLKAPAEALPPDTQCQLIQSSQQPCSWCPACVCRNRGYRGVLKASRHGRTMTGTQEVRLGSSLHDNSARHLGRLIWALSPSVTVKGAKLIIPEGWELAGGHSFLFLLHMKYGYLSVPFPKAHLS